MLTDSKDWSQPSKEKMQMVAQRYASINALLCYSINLNSHCFLNNLIGIFVFAFTAFELPFWIFSLMHGRLLHKTPDNRIIANTCCNWTRRQNWVVSSFLCCRTMWLYTTKSAITRSWNSPPWEIITRDRYFKAMSKQKISTFIIAIKEQKKS